MYVNKTRNRSEPGETSVCQGLTAATSGRISGLGGSEASRGESMHLGARDTCISDLPMSVISCVTQASDFMVLSVPSVKWGDNW